MIVKLKCVSNIDFTGEESDYLTADKIYDAIKSEAGEVALICDKGDVIHDNIDDYIHGKWEVVK